MARNERTGPMTDEEMAAFKSAMREQGEELREALVEDLGGVQRITVSGSDLSRMVARTNPANHRWF